MREGYFGVVCLGFGPRATHDMAGRLRAGTGGNNNGTQPSYNLTFLVQAFDTCLAVGAFPRRCRVVYLL